MSARCDKTELDFMCFWCTEKECEVWKEFLSWCDDVSYSCSYCDMPDYVLPIFAKKYGGRYKRFTLDCKDNSLGYRIDNITWACDRCNTIKSDILSFDEARKLSQEYIKPKWQELLEENLL